MRVRLQRDIALRDELVDDPLHALAVEAHAAGDPRHRLRAFGERDRAQDLPARAGEPEARHQPVAGDQQAPVEPEHLEDQFGDGLAGRSASRH